MKKKTPLKSYIPSQETSTGSVSSQNVPPKVEVEPTMPAEPAKIAAPVSRVKTLTPTRKTIPKKTIVPASNVDKYLPKRNDKNPMLSEGQNYTKDILNSSITAETANEIANLINKTMPGRRPYMIYQTDSGIGILTLALLEYPDVEIVVAYESNEELRSMLQNNIKAFGFSEKTQIPNTAFDHIPMVDRDSVLLLNLKGNFNADQFKETMEGARIASMVAIITPRSVTLPAIEGYNCHQYPLKSSTEIKLHMCMPEYSWQGEKVLEGKMTASEELKWKQNLREFLRTLLTPAFVKKPEHLEKILTPDAMNRWTIAFTEKSYNEKLGENYEQLEALGDKALDFVFYQYVLERYPNMTEHQLTQLKKNYISKDYQGPLATKLGLVKWIRVLHQHINLDIREDVFESFFGALVMNCTKLISRGTGELYSYNFILLIFNEIPDLRPEEDAKTQVLQTFEKLGIQPHPRPIEVETQEGWEIHTNPAAYRFFKQYNIDLPRVLGRALRPREASVETSSVKDKNLILADAYKQALETLISHGITRDFVEDLRNRREFDKPYLAPYYDKALTRAKKAGYIKLKFVTPKGTLGKDQALVQLFAIDAEDIDTRIASISVSDIEEGKKILLERYAQGK